MVRANKSTIIIFLVLMAVLFTFLFIPPFPQPSGYNNFADKREFFGIPFALNVISNIPFIILGILGLLKMRLEDYKLFSKKYESWPFFMAFVSAVLIGLGSAYYHLYPNNYTLLWDRLPMTLIFMSLMSIIIEDRISIKTGVISLILSIIIGSIGTIYWEYTELKGEGDLRYYGIVQLLPLIIIIFLLLIFPKKYKLNYYWYKMLGWFSAAKIFEMLDKQIYNITLHLISGHVLKHLLAAIALYFLIQYMHNRVSEPT